MKSEVDNKIIKSTINGSYVGRDQYNQYIIMLEDSEREFVVTHNANIKPVSYFTGRETELNDLRQRVEEGRKSVLVSGMGGVGKTHICRKLFEEYLTKHDDNGDGPFKHIGYIEYSGDMNSDLQNCLKYKQQEDPKLNQEVAWRELTHLAANGKLLLFVDNVNRPMREDPGLERLKSIPGAIILTSRRTSFSKEFEPYRIGFLSAEQCREIYEKIRFDDSGKKVEDEEVPDLVYIIEKLAARHTITIEFLANLAQTKRWSVKTLRKELEQNGFKLEYENEQEELVNIQKSYETMYKLSELTGAEQNILEAFSIFPYIPLAAEICNQWLLSDAGASKEDDILTRLYRKGWLQFNIEQESYAMHPVFAQFIYDKCRPNAEKHAGLIRVCEKCLEIPDSGSPLECQKFIPFGENIVEKLNMYKELEKADFIYILASLLHYLWQDKKAEKLYNRLLGISKDRLGENHQYTSSCYNNLAQVYEEQGEYGKAKELYERSLKICERILGENHPDTATIYNNLAKMYMKQGEYEKAEELQEKSLEIRERILGENHLSTADSYDNLAQVYVKQGEYGEAEKLQEKSLRIRERILGEDHPYTATSYNNLAQVYEEQGEYGKAEEWYEKGLRICERMLGENHPSTATGYNNLAVVYMRQGEYAKAEELCKKSLSIRERILGENHLSTADSYDNLAQVYVNQGEYGKAEKLQKKSLRIRKRVLGEDHPYMAIEYNNLAEMYARQDEYRKAEELYRKSLGIYERVLGEEHPSTAIVYNNLAEMYARQGEYRKAEELYRKSLSIHKRMLGKEHPSTAIVYENLAVLYESQGEYEMAIIYYYKAYKIFVLKLGLRHPDTQNAYENMKRTYFEWNPGDNFNHWLEEKLKEEE